jgi:hypothetical protein
MGMIKVFRQGKGSFFEWRHEHGKPLGRIRNQGEGVFLAQEFSSAEEARSFCQKELDKDPAPYFYILQENDIIDTIYNRAYQIAKDKKENRIYAIISLIVVILVATGASLLLMPFEVMIYHLLFIGGMGAVYLLVYSTGVHWNLEGVAVVLMLIVILSISVPLFTN